MGWRDGSALRALAALPGDLPHFDFQYPHGGLQPSVTVVPGDSISSSGFLRHQAHIWCTDICATHTHKNNNNKVEFLKF